LPLNVSSIALLTILFIIDAMEPMQLILIMFIAFFVAVLFSLLGLGGAIIYTPLFFWLGIPLLTAIPMALLLNTITTASASVTYLKHRLVDIKLAFPIILTSIIGALTGSYIAHKIDTGLIILLLSTVLFIAGMRMLFFNSIGFPVRLDERKKILIGSSAAFLIGIISALVGIGGGTFIVSLLLILGFETKNAAATSAFIITFMSFSGFLGYLGFGTEILELKVLLFAGAAAFTGAQVGSRIIFRRVSPSAINRMFAIVLLFVVGKLLYGLF